jgi:myo-inositol-1(or 4)-monophosphatase
VIVPATPPALRELARAIAREAGALILDRRQAGVRVAATKSSHTDVVTAADRESEALIRARLIAARPEDTVLGEEGGEQTGPSGLTWLVDPIDGTVNYLYGIPAYAVSIAVADHDRTLAGVVLNPVSDECWSAAAGAGADLNGRPIQIRPEPALSAALIGTGFGYATARRAAQARTLQHILPRVRDIRRAGSAALDLCAVACGRLDGYYERGLHRWDHAAGALIAREAGAEVAGPNGAGESSELLICAGPKLFGEFAELVLAAGAASD